MSKELLSAWEVSGDMITNRVIEYLGGDSPDTVTCQFIASCDAKDPRIIHKHPLADLEHLLAEGSSLARSLDDKKSALIHLDIEYVNFDDPASAFMDPWQAFAFQKPVVDAIEELLVKWGIRPLHLITGQGHHFVWSVPRGTPCEKRLATLTFPGQIREGQSENDTVFDGTDLLMEYFANEIRALASPRTEIPVELTAVHVGPGSTKHREMISIDISEYGDPLESRMIRIPFTAYRKPWACGLVSALGLENQIGQFVILPLHEMDVRQCLKCRQDAGDIVSLAKCAGVRIPRQETGTMKLIDSYLASELRPIHEDYFRDTRAVSDPPNPDIGNLPGCLHEVLTFPNELLLKPAVMQLVTRYFITEGWRPRHIAGLIGSRFANPDYNWGTAWDGYSPERRADFYVRIFSNLIALGRDSLIDYNCTSQQEKGFCWPLPGSCSLEASYKKLKSPKLKS